MNDITKQTREYELLLEVAAVPFAERHQAMMGAELYFDRGWPINHFTVGMAARAGNGLAPPVYDGLGSEERYFLGSEERYFQATNSPTLASDVGLSLTRPCRIAPKGTIGTYKLTAKPSLFSARQLKGELRSVAFIATSPTETMKWFAINCGQFERAFCRLLPRGLATKMVSTLTRGEYIEFPGLYEREQFGCGFVYEGMSYL